MSVLAALPGAAPLAGAEPLEEPVEEVLDALAAQDGSTDPPLPGLGGTAVANASPIFFINHPIPDTVPSAHSSGEPTIGVNAKTGRAMFMMNFGVARAAFDDTARPPAATWKDVTHPVLSTTTLDPLLGMDPVTGRTIAMHLSGEASRAMFTDDDGDTWLPTEPPTVAPSFDHQKLGVGPFAPPLSGGTPVYPNAWYYCANGVELNQCARSDDGGLTWGAPVPIDVTQCGGVKTDGTQIGTFNGHLAVGPDGTVFVPMRNCFDQPGVAGGPMRYGLRISRDNGLTWDLKVVPDSASSRSNAGVGVDAAGNAYVVWSHGFPSGRALARVLRPDGTWGPVTDVGAPFGVRHTRFTEAIAGDAGRAAVSFFGTPTPGSSDDCGNTQEWHLYVSLTYDAGATWTTVDATPVDPIQRGGVGRNAPCRNLLDFNGMAIDAKGRVLVGYADGCTTRPCQVRTGSALLSRDGLGTIARQVGGPTLRAAEDPAAPQPVYAFARPGQVLAGQAAVLDAAAVGGQPPYALAWDFDGDGAFDDAAGTTVSFPTSAAGAFSVSVQATDADGATGAGQAWVVALGAPGPDTLRFTWAFDAAGCTDAQGWTAAGDPVGWHLTSDKPRSAPCAWYHGVDGVKRYPTFQVTNLVSPCLFLPPGSDSPALGFALAGQSESGFDFLSVQARDSCTEGVFTTVQRFSGTFGNLAAGVYAPQTVSLADLVIAGGGPFQVRLRFTADEVFEFAGFQVDDLALYVDDDPPVLATAGDRTGDEGAAMDFVVQATDPDGDPVTLRAEDLPDGAAFDGTTGQFSWVPSHAQIGAHEVTFVASDGLLEDRETVTLTVLNLPPTPAGSAEPAETDRLTAVQFTDHSTDPNGGSIVAWLWKFGDGATSTEQNPQHTYAKLGTKAVNLTVTDDSGASVEATVATVKVKNIPPKGGMGNQPGGNGAQVAEVEANRVDPVQFTDTSEDRDGWLASWSWEFGDGATSADQHPSHQYTQLGAYDARLTPTDNDGDAGTDAEVRVRVVNLLPSAAFTHEPQYPTALLPATFDATATDRDGSVVSYLWDFGDGATSTAEDPAHVYLSGGFREVRLTVTDNDGGQRSVTETIFVCAPGLSIDALVATLEHFRLAFNACLRVNEDLLPLLGSLPGALQSMGRDLLAGLRLPS